YWEHLTACLEDSVRDINQGLSGIPGGGITIERPSERDIQCGKATYPARYVIVSLDVPAHLLRIVCVRNEYAGHRGSPQKEQLNLTLDDQLQNVLVENGPQLLSLEEVAEYILSPLIQ